jgi:hypothetical protein
MSAKAQAKSDPFEHLKSELNAVPVDHDCLAEYVGELEHHRNEEDIFLRLAFRNVHPGGAYSGSDRFVVSAVSELYEPLNSDQKIEIRRWWHEKTRHQAGNFADLRTRLSRLT